ncbi:MAG TPA: PEGA domain-containing protein, partial [Spirochaetia bacterium]
AVVRFAPTPPSATLKVDGATVTAGASPAVYLAPGPHLVEITAMGYASVVRSVLLPAQEQTVIDDTLEKTITGHIGVTSEPPAADVYVGSLWVGKTPLFVDRPSTRQRGVLTLPGYYDLPFSLEPTSRDSLSFSLQKDLGKRDELQKKAREDFYTSFGWFALSLPLSLFTYGMAIDFALQSNAYGSAGNAISAAASASTYYFFQGVYYGGIAVNVALFTWMVFRIINYVSISNGSAG